MSSLIGCLLVHGLLPHVRMDLLVAVQVKNDQVVPCVGSALNVWTLVMLLCVLYHRDRAFRQVIDDRFATAGAEPMLA